MKNEKEAKGDISEAEKYLLAAKNFLLLLTEHRDSLEKELQETAFAIADLGKKMYELKEELRIVLIKLEKCK